MLIAPFSETFTTINDEVNGEWIKNYALNSFEYLIVIIPIISLLIFIPKLKNKTIKKITTPELNCLNLFICMEFLPINTPGKLYQWDR